MKMHVVLKKYQDWKVENPDQEYQYDQIEEFFADLSRGEMYSFMEWCLTDGCNPVCSCNTLNYGYDAAVCFDCGKVINTKLQEWEFE